MTPAPQAVASPGVALRALLARHAGWYAGLGLVILLASVLESLSLAAFLPVFDAVLHPQGPEGRGGALGALAAVAQRLPVGDPVVSAAVLLVGVIVLKEVVVLGREWLNALASGGVLRDLQAAVMQRYAAAPYGFFLDQKHAELLYDAVVGPHQVSQLLRRVPQFAAELLRVAAILAVLGLAFPAATAVVVLVLGGFGAVMQGLSQAVAYRLGAQRTASHARQTHLMSEFLGGIRHLRVFGVSRRWEADFAGEVARYGGLLTRALVWLALPKAIIQVTAVSLLVGALAYFKLSQPQRFAANLSMLSLFGVALLQLLPSLVGLARLKMEIDEALPVAQRLQGALQRPADPPRDGAKPFHRLQEAITFEDVSFSYPGRRPVLRGLTATLRRGTTTALVGLSGAGKTTLLNLLLGLYEPTAGTIRVDRAPLSDYQRQSWRQAIGFVSQDPFIIHGTVAENIRFGRDGFSDEQLRAAARVANAEEFIAELPRGYETVVGERGLKLSGGQLQRLAIARALLGEPQVLIFDEATSHLDAVAQQHVQVAVEQAVRHRTTLIVAHRLSSVRSAQTILVLEDGCIVEQGSHDALLSGRGRYAHLVASEAG